jgi:hypothetical protein
MAALKQIMIIVRKPDAGDAFSYWIPHLKDWKLNLSKGDLFDF